MQREESVTIRSAMMRRGRCGLALAFLLAVTPSSRAAEPDTAAAQPGTAAAAPAQGAASGLPLPRYVSLKADRVNLRTGPGTEYPTTWVYRQAGLPLEVVKEFEGWRQVRDAEGTSGWVLQSFLSGRRTALVAPWEAKGAGKAKSEKPSPIPIRYSDSERSNPVAFVEPGVIANVQSCDSRWCQVSIESYHGYLLQKQLWGVYPDEIVK
jgi:SH3-like domain-containing protein